MCYNGHMAKRYRRNTVGSITIEGGANVWAHELYIAKALANIGHNIRFIPAHNSVHSADAYVDNTIFEFKSPEGSTVKAVERNIVRALDHQSKNIVISTARMKRITDRSVMNYLISRMREGKGLKRLMLVTRDGKAVDINELVR